MQKLKYQAIYFILYMTTLLDPYAQSYNGLCALDLTRLCFT